MITFRCSFARIGTPYESDKEKNVWVTIPGSGTSRDSPTRAGWIGKGKKKPTIMFTGYEDKVDAKAVREMGGLIAAGVVSI